MDSRPAIQVLLATEASDLAREVAPWISGFAVGESNLIDVHIMRLREKLEANGRSRLIHTIRGAGYSLRRVP